MSDTFNRNILRELIFRNQQLLQTFLSLSLFLCISLSRSFFSRSPSCFSFPPSGDRIVQQTAGSTNSEWRDTAMSRIYYLSPLFNDPRRLLFFFLLRAPWFERVLGLGLDARNRSEISRSERKSEWPELRSWSMRRTKTPSEISDRFLYRIAHIRPLIYLPSDFTRTETKLCGEPPVTHVAVVARLRNYVTCAVLSIFREIEVCHAWLVSRRHSAERECTALRKRLIVFRIGCHYPPRETLCER